MTQAVPSVQHRKVGELLESGDPRDASASEDQLKTRALLQQADRAHQ